MHGEHGRWAPDSEHEVRERMHGELEFGSSQRAHQRNADGRGKPLDGVVVRLQRCNNRPDIDSGLSRISVLLNLSGAHCIQAVKNIPTDRDKFVLIMLEEHAPETRRDFDQVCAKWGQRPVKESWLLDSISYGAPLPRAGYELRAPLDTGGGGGGHKSESAGTAGAAADAEAREGDGGGGEGAASPSNSESVPDSQTPAGGACRLASALPRRLPVPSTHS
mmetsp:Transcript_26231/g.86151  ORF Transcript_26231/g.86151 Transcript_26231/m.86151 type:complete len:220 (+) Transcript_26231:3-662(+)